MTGRGRAGRGQFGVMVRATWIPAIPGFFPELD